MDVLAHEERTRLEGGWVGAATFGALLCSSIRAPSELGNESKGSLVLLHMYQNPAPELPKACS